MLAQELGACLCLEGDRHLAQAEPPLAAAFFLAAFSCHAPSAVGHVQSLPEDQGAAVLGVLEAWSRGQSPIPEVHWDDMAVVSLTGAQASAFLASLCPEHPAAALHGLVMLLAHGRAADAEGRCSALLDAGSPLRLELQLTRALAWLLSGTRRAKGLADYLQAFATSGDRVLGFIRTHQQPHLPLLFHALREHLLEHPEATDNTHCQRLLAALDNTGRWSDALSPEALLHAGRFEACWEACGRALESQQTGGGPRGRREDGPGSGETPGWREAGAS